MNPQDADVARWLANMSEDGGYSSNVISELLEKLGSRRWAYGSEYQARRELLISMLLAEPYLGLHIEYASKIAQKMPFLTAHAGPPDE